MGYKKILSFSLWGKQPIYLVGSIRNVEIAQELFPDWICRFHVPADKIPSNVEKLQSFDNVEIVYIKSDWEMSSGRFSNGKSLSAKTPVGDIFWKWLPYFDTDVDCFFSKDVDSRLSIREKIAMDEFIESDKQFHIMRDHPACVSGMPIFGALWGIKRTIGLDIRKLIDEYPPNKKTDQQFLGDIIYPLIKNQSMIHHDESCASGCQLPPADPNYWKDGKCSEHRKLIPRKGLEIIGIDVDENDVPNGENEMKLEKWIKHGIYYWWGK